MRNRAAAQTAGTEPFVVAIGASAGAVDALRTLLSAMPPECDVVFLVVLHRWPEYDARFTELLQPYTDLAVEEVRGTVGLKPNSVLVIAPGVQVGRIDSHVRIAPATISNSGSVRPIDHVFRTLAAAHGSRSIGIVLTGGGTDGAEGLRRIKARRGAVIVQDPGEAEHGGMPSSAIDTGIVDHVLPLREIAPVIMRYVRPLPVPGTHAGLDDHKGRTAEAGFDQHLTKPADRASLEAILGRSAVHH